MPEGDTDQKSENMVPREALVAMREDLKESHSREVDGLRRQLDDLREQLKGGRQEAPTLTRAQLQAQVDDGRMSESEMDEVLERQREARLDKKLNETLDKKLTQGRRMDKVEAEAQRYLDAVPNVLKEGTPERAKVASEIDFLASLGEDPNDPLTKVKALRAAFGDVNALERAKAKATRETHEETSGGGGDGDGGGSSGDKAPKELTPRQKSFYAEQIKKGFYTGWDDPRIATELKYNDSARSKRMQALHGTAA